MVLLASSATHAEDPRDAARGHYAHGVELASHGEYEAALREFTAAYDVNPHFAVLYNIAQCHIALGHAVEAIDTLSRYLAEGKDQIPKERRDQVDAQVALMETHVTRTVPLGQGEPKDVALEPPPVEAKPAPSTLRVQCADTGVEVRVDGVALDLATAARGVTVAPGAHRIAFAGASGAVAEQNLDVPAGGTALVFCGTAPPAPGGDRSAPPSSERHVGAATIAGYVMGGTGLALGGATLAHYLWNKGRYDDWRAAGAGLAPGTAGYHDRQVANNDLADSIDRASTVTVGLAVASGALLAGGVTLWLLDRRGAPGDTVARSVAPGGQGIAFAWAGPKAAGSLTWRGVW